jgi:hypothetical protein
MIATIKGQLYNINSGCKGNGVTVWNSAQQENGDYKTLAHISELGEITYYSPIPKKVKQYIETLKP